MKTVPEFKAETDLCAAFIAALPERWTAYPETEGWDILLVRDDGCQVGIQAKLKLNAKVLLQAVERESWYNDHNPDYRAVLVPAATNAELVGLAPYCSITIIKLHEPERYHRDRRQFWPQLPDHHHCEADKWYDLCPTKRCQLPEYVPQVTAGASAPLQLTAWKIGAIRLCILLAETGYLTRDDFKRNRIDIRRWVSARWIVPGNGAYVAGTPPNFRHGHPADWDNIAADVAKWQRPVPLMTTDPTLLRGAA